MRCPHCGRDIDDQEVARHLAAKGGAARTELKREASRRNGRLGGRPRKLTVRSGGRMT